jgi:hypothetical protein
LKGAVLQDYRISTTPLYASVELIDRAWVRRGAGVFYWLTGAVFPQTGIAEAVETAWVRKSIQFYRQKTALFDPFGVSKHKC